MQFNCICCTLREDLLNEVSKLAQEGRFDFLLIESTGISEPIPIAQTFTFQDENGQSLTDITRLDTMITVVDAASFLDNYKSSEAVSSSGESLGEDDERSIANLLASQIEFADVIILNKIDLAGPALSDEVEAVLSALNPVAKIIRSTRGVVPLHSVIGTGLFDYEKAASSAGWLKELQGESIPESEEYGISSFVYRSRHPFDATLLWEYLLTAKHWNGVLRSKGFFWVAADHRVAYEWALAGGASEVTAAGYWWAVIPKDQWDPDASRPDQQPNWHPRWGDRAQELVFIGQHLDREAISAALDACLLSADLAKTDSTTWDNFENPFPKFPNEEEDNSSCELSA